MSDAINRARDIIERYLPAMPDQQAAFVTRDAARALDAAGLLVSPEHDAAVAAKALRDDPLAALIERCRDEGWEGVVWHHPDGRMVKLKVRDLPEG